MKYQLIELHTGDKSYTIEEIHPDLVAAGFRYDVLTMIPVESGVWELLVTSRKLDEFRSYVNVTMRGFSIKECCPPSRGLFIRASIIRHQARRTQHAYLEEAVLFYDNLLKSYSYLSALLVISKTIDMASEYATQAQILWNVESSWGIYGPPGPFMNLTQSQACVTQQQLAPFTVPKL